MRSVGRFRPSVGAIRVEVRDSHAATRIGWFRYWLRVRRGPKSWKQRCCSGVGSVCRVDVLPSPAICMVLTASVPRSVSRVRKLWTGRWSVRLRPALARAAGERHAGGRMEAGARLQAALTSPRVVYCGE